MAMEIRKHRAFTGWLAAAVAASVLAALPQAAQAEEATGKVVWVDQKNNALLLECVDKGCPKIPSAKTGETFTFVIPASLKGAVGGLKEGQQVTVTYQAAKDGAYTLSAVK
jgi:hypothetical protein